MLIYAQQSFGSFSTAAKGAAGGLTAQGCRVEVSDLYAIKFQVSAPAEDINGDVKDEEHFWYQGETRLAWEEGSLAENITTEQTNLN